MHDHIAELVCTSIYSVSVDDTTAYMAGSCVLLLLQAELGKR